MRAAYVLWAPARALHAATEWCGLNMQARPKQLNLHFHGCFCSALNENNSTLQRYLGKLQGLEELELGCTPLLGITRTVSSLTTLTRLCVSLDSLSDPVSY
jgi:hypothetical protein